MHEAPKYHTNSNNPNIRPKWVNAPRQAIRLPKVFHAIAWDMCQALDQGLVSEEEIREVLKSGASRRRVLTEVKEALDDIANYQRERP